MSKADLLRTGDEKCDLHLIANGQRFRVHRAVLAQESDLIRSWLESPLINQGCNKLAVISLDLPEIRIPSRYNPDRDEIDPMDVFKLFLELSYHRHQYGTYTLRLCYNHGLAAVCHSKNYSNSQFASLAVLSDFLFSSRLKEACDIYLSFMGNYDFEQLRFARKFSLKRLFYKTVRSLIVKDPVGLESSSELTLDEVTDSLINRDPWHRDHCFRFPYLVRQAAQLNISPQVFDREIIDNSQFIISFCSVDRLKLLLKWCEVCKELWDPFELFWYNRAMNTLKKIKVSQCHGGIEEARLVLAKIERVISEAHRHRKEIDRTLFKLEF